VPLVIEPRAMLVGDRVQVVPVHDRVDEPDPPVMLVGLRVHVRPAGETAEVRATVPVKPLKPETEIVEGPVEPDETMTLVGFVAMVKSWTVKVTVVL